MTESPSPIAESLVAAVGRDRAFDAFHAEFGRWWPRAYSFAGEAGLKSIALGAAPGDLCTEIGPHGFRVDWGRMLVVDRPNRLLFLWQIAGDRTPQPDPAQSSEVEVRFAAVSEGTRVDLVHRAFERNGDGAADYRDAMASEHGWRFILDAFAAYLTG